MRISKLSVVVQEKSVINNISLVLEPGSLHALLGPNGSGKSSLAYALLGHPHYTIAHGNIFLDGVDITQEPVHKRAQRGIFLSFQQPCAIPGVTVITFLQEAYRALKGPIEVGEFYALLIKAMDVVEMDYAFAYRHMHDGFSGGERKRLEMLQLLLFEPKVALLDEIDSGLDIDAQKVIIRALQYARQKNPVLRLLIITHYQRILEHIVPDYVHVLKNGSIAYSGDAQIVSHIEQKGYDACL